MTAHLVGPPDRSLELQPVRYQFEWEGSVVSAPGDLDYDANWLVVRLNASDGGRKWSADGATFLTWELEDLAAWFGDLAGRAIAVPSDFEGLEPNLHFSAEGVGDDTRLKAFYELEYRPEDIRWEIPFGEFFVEFRPSAETMKRFAQEMENQLREFPSRGVAPPRPDPSSGYIPEGASA